MADKKNYLDKEVFTTYDAARICSANIASIKNWIAKGLLRAFRTPGGHYRIKRRDLELFVQKYNMPYPFGGKANKKVVMLDADKKAQAAVRTLVGAENFSSFAEPLHAALNVGLDRPDIIIIDIKDKKLDGTGFLDMLYSYPDTCNIHVLIHSSGLSKARSMELRKGYNIEEIVEKAGDPQVLIEAIRALS